MAPPLESYVVDRWLAAEDEGTPLADAVTGEPVARISNTGLDISAMPVMTYDVLTLVAT